MLADMPGTTCVCHHSYSAHVAGTKEGCSFCNCVEFVDASARGDAAPTTKKLSEQAQRALDVLAENTAFSHVSRDRLVEIAEDGKRHLYLTGQVVMRQGSESDSLHIVVKGKVEVERDVAGKTIHLAELRQGDIVGEMGVLNGDARTATVKALEDLETLEIGAAHLKKVFQQDPEVLLAVMKVINERLRSTEELVETSVRVALAQLSQN